MSENKATGFFSIIIAAILLFEGIFASMTPVRVNAAEDYRLWRQWDERWGDIYLGTSTDTMARSGCLVTAVAILAVHSGTKDAEIFNPGTFVQELNNVGAFDSWGAIASWAKVTEVIPEVKFVKSGSFSSTTQSGKAQEILSVINEGYYVICNVGGHWVFVEGVNGSDVYMIDSAKDEILMFAGYSNSNITSWQAYTGKNPPGNIIGPLVTTTATTTSTTTTTTSTTTTTTSTTTTFTTTTAPIIYPSGEYYCYTDGFTLIYNSNTGSNEIGCLKKGNIVNIIESANGRGCFVFGEETGWVDMNKLTFAGASDIHERGDINNDDQITISDLALLNEYLLSLTTLADGVSVLRECEIEAADVNGDGSTDNLDIQKYLSLICT